MKTIVSLSASLLLHTTIAWSQAPDRVFVHFATDRWELTKDTRARLDSLTDSLDVSDKIELHGHCDTRGSVSYNEQLAQNRVQAVRHYLLQNGWDAKDIVVAQGHGELQPIVAENSPATLQLNRRVEIRILHGANKTVVERVTATPPPAPPASTPLSSIGKQLNDSTLKAGDVVTLRNMQFEGGMHQLLPHSRPIIEELLQTMVAHPTLVIKIVGQICCEDGPQDGLDIEIDMRNLSVMRAKAVRDYLVRNGIAQERVYFEGRGHQQPIHPYPEKNEEERIDNRRVEIVILKK